MVLGSLSCGPVVVHDPASAPVPSARSGCGIIGSPTSAVVMLGAYPGSGAMTISGTLRVTYDEAVHSLTIDGLVAGFAPGTTGGWHVHEGYTCADATAVGGHYYATGGLDAWQPLAYAADSRGVARVSVTVHGYSLASKMPIGAAATERRDMPTLGRAIVFHDATGARVGCGLIEPLHGEMVAIGKYPRHASPVAV